MKNFALTDIGGRRMLLLGAAMLVAGCSQKPEDEIRHQVREVRLSDGTQCVAIVHEAVVQSLVCNWKSST